ncbi:MAG: class I SAM-dependent methyltransferase, partial [Lachnospiraceae bacterium]|nr:class I SAM-dependent methyltransferase [Lachnospiraceae bacterium]
MIAENREDCSFIWENYYDTESDINEYDLTIFVRNSEASVSGQELFTRFQEVHLQRGYTLEEMQRFIGLAGLAFIRAYDADTLGEVTDTSERIYCVAQEKRKVIQEIKC